MENKKILIVDDESRIRKLVSDFLVRSGYDVLEASNGQDAVLIFDKNTDISLIVLDVMMPFMDGWETCEAIRKDSNVPIIMLTAKDSEEDQLKGYNLKIDDYVTKPFSPKILTARIDALIRRTEKTESNEDIIKEGIIEINSLTHTVTVDNEIVELSFKEFELIKYFVKNKGIALSRDKILNDVWNYDYFGDARTIDTHIKKLRQKLGTAGEYIKTIWGLGYKFEVQK